MLQGIVSWGNSGCRDFGAVMKVSHYMSWISDIINGNATDVDTFQLLTD